MDIEQKSPKSCSASNLLIFNLELDLDSKVLATSHDWVNAFSPHFNNIRLVSTHVGRIALPENVTVIELGGGSLRNRILGGLKLCLQIPFLIRNRRELSVFHHMATYPAAFLSPLIKFLAIKQSIWYSHSHASFSFKWCSRFMDHIYGPAVGAVPLKSQKIRFLGHGIKLEGFLEWKQSENLERSGLVSFGRIAPIKNFHLLLTDDFPADNCRVDIFGPSLEDRKYDSLLYDKASKHGVRLTIHPPVAYSEVAKILMKYSFFFSGTPMSVDKAAVEAALSGCFVISPNHNLLEITGMKEVWKRVNLPIPNSIFDQINQLWRYQNNFELHRLVSQEAAKKNNLEKLVKEIANDFIK